MTSTTCPTMARNVAKAGVMNITDMASCTRATNKLISWTMSLILKDRGAFPSEFFKDVAGDGVVLKLPPAKDDGTNDDMGEGISKFIELCQLIFAAIENGDVTNIKLQFHDFQDPMKIYEEWGFDIAYNSAGQACWTSVNSQGALVSADKPQAAALPAAPASLTHDQFTETAKTVSAEIRRMISSLNPLDYLSNDVRLGLVVTFTMDAYENGRIPKEFTVVPDRDTGNVENAKRFKAAPKVTLPFHDINFKVKTGHFDPERTLQSPEAPVNNKKVPRKVIGQQAKKSGKT